MTAAHKLPTARAIKLAGRHSARRAKSEARLAELLPATLELHHSYHVISHGDIDAMSYLAHVVNVQRLDHVMISTWVMAMADMRILERWVDEQRIDGPIDFRFGEHITGQYGDVYAAACQLSAFSGGNVKVARNHSKVILARHEKDDFYFTAEGSANINTNPRIEQTVLTLDEDLYLFYRDFFDELTCIHGRKPTR